MYNLDFDLEPQIINSNCIEHDQCANCFQPNPKKCAKPNRWNPRNKLLILSFMLTDECNLHCDYCWQRLGIPKYGTFTKQTIDNILNYFYDNYNEYTLAMAVLGGEPTLYPDLIEEIAKQQLKLYDKLSCRIYSNGYITNPDAILDLCHKYENITFQISQNYDIITYKDMANYIELASVVITEDMDLNEKYDLILKIKNLGYKSVILNFDVNTQTKYNNPYAFYNNCIKFCERLIPLMSDNFAIENFIDNPYYLHKPNDFTPVLYLFPDSKIYLSNYKHTPAIGDLDHPLNWEKIYECVTKSPCRTCNNDDICSIHALKDFLQSDGTWKKEFNTCLRQLITVSLGRMYHKNRFGYNTLNDRTEDHLMRKVRNESS